MNGDNHHERADSDGEAGAGEPPTAAGLLAALRAGGPAAPPWGRPLRAEVAALLARTLRPADHGIAHRLLEREIADAEAEGRGASEALYTLVAAVARFARAEDAPLLWRARQATPETRAGVDVEQVVRAGPDAVRRHLRALRDAGGPPAEDAAAALAWIAEGAASGAFDDLPGYFAWADERFGLRVSGPT